MHRLGRYDLICELWPTALGTRYAARDATSIVTLQHIAPPMPGRALGELQELGILATRLRHPHIGAVLDLLLMGEDKAIVSEYVPGVSLRSLMGLAWLARSPLPAAVALRIILDLLEALEHVKTCDVMGGAARALHGGVTPDAALVTASGVTLLADAALQGVIAEGSGAWRHPDLLAYRAPEQLEPEPAATACTDVYGAGVLLWEMLANRALFGGSVGRARTVRPGTEDAEGPASRGWLADDVDAVHARQNVIERVQFAHVARLTAVPPALAHVVGRAITRDPAVRFRSARDLARAIVDLDEAIASHAEVGATLALRVGHLLAARQAAIADS